MNTYKLRTALIAFVTLQLLIIPVQTSAYSKKNRKNVTETSFADVAVPMVITGAALGLLGAACLYGDSTKKIHYASTVDLLAQSVCNECNSRYVAMIQIMRDAYLLPSVRQEDYQRSFRVGVSEGVLYQLASNKRSHYIDAYSSRLRDDIGRIQYHQEQILYRIGILQDKEAYDCNFTLFDAEELHRFEYISRDLVELSINLETLSACLEYHSSYFALYDIENTLWARYSEELAGLYNKAYTYNALVGYLHSVSWKKNVTAYAHQAYMSQIMQDVALLQDVLNSMPHYYVDRLGAAQELYNQLDFLYGVLLAHQ